MPKPPNAVVQVVAGLVVALLGAVWILQGLDLLGRDGGMNGEAIWAVVGAPILVAGLALAAAGTRLMRAILFGVSPTDPATFTAVAIALAAVALAACWIPARRALRTDPLEALRGN